MNNDYNFDFKSDNEQSKTRYKNVQNIAATNDNVNSANNNNSNNNNGINGSNNNKYDYNSFEVTNNNRIVVKNNDNNNDNKNSIKNNQKWRPTFHYSLKLTDIKNQNIPSDSYKEHYLQYGKLEKMLRNLDRRIGNHSSVCVRGATVLQAKLRGNIGTLIVIVLVWWVSFGTAVLCFSHYFAGILIAIVCCCC